MILINGILICDKWIAGMIAHRHGDCNYVYYSLNLHASDSNHTIRYVAKLLRGLELEPSSSAKILFKDVETFNLFKLVHEGKDMCFDVLQGSEENRVPPRPLPLILNVQLNNPWKDNKRQFVFYFWLFLIVKMHFLRGVCLFPFGWSHPWRHQCIIWTMEYNGAHK